MQILILENSKLNQNENIFLISITLINSQDMSYAMYFNAFSAVIRDYNKQNIHFFKITNESSQHSPSTFHYKNDSGLL